MFNTSNISQSVAVTQRESVNSRSIQIAGFATAIVMSMQTRLQRSADESGQGTVEYVALAMLVAALMLGVVAVAKGQGEHMGKLITGKIESAIRGLNTGGGSK